MASRRSSLWPILAAVVGCTAVLVVLPDRWKQWAPDILRAPQLHLGIDLAGGTQLDFRISEQEIDDQLRRISEEIANGEATGQDVAILQAERISIEDQKMNLTEAIRTVIEKRVNALGVSEATITPSTIGGEKHLFVECPGVIDVQKCIETVGKTIKLEFKEEFTQPTEEYKREVAAKVGAAVKKMSASGTSLQGIGQDLGNQLGSCYGDNALVFKGDLPAGLGDAWTATPQRLLRREGEFLCPQQQQKGVTAPEKGIFLAEVLTPRTQTGRLVNDAPTAFKILAAREKGSTAYHDDQLLDDAVPSEIRAGLLGMKQGDLRAVATGTNKADMLFLRQILPGREEVDVSHILVSYAGVAEVDVSVSRTREEAMQRAKDLKARLDRGANFASLARSESDGPSRTKGGSIGALTRGSMVPAFETVAFTQPPGKISDPVETVFGFHLIRVDRAPRKIPETASYDQLSLTRPAALQRANELIEELQSGRVQSVEEALRLRFLFFSFTPTGWKDTPLDGKHFRSAHVTVDQTTNTPVVQILFDEEGGTMFRELTARNIQKPIAIFVGGEMVSAPIVNEEISGGSATISGGFTIEQARRLSQDLNTGAIPAPIYLAGQSTIEATLGDAALRTSLQAGLIGMIIVMLYMIVMYRLLGLVACCALLIYATLFIAMLKFPLPFTSQYIVLTLAGVAGAILSIGMAVDANVLVFERMKEELRKGRQVKTAVETSFLHAWPAIRDGNISTLITSAILFQFGTSIIRGFAVSLALGVLMSLLTAVVMTRWMLRKIAATSLAERVELFGGRK